MILCKQFRLQIWQSLDLSSNCLYSIYKSTKWDSNIFVYDIRNNRSTFCLRIYFYHVHMFRITDNKKKLILNIDIKGFFYFVCLWIIIVFVWTFLNAGERRQLMRCYCFETSLCWIYHHFLPFSLTMLVFLSYHARFLFY